MSPSMRGRGLKPVHCTMQQGRINVALHAGAWIETAKTARISVMSVVALHAGAWIETSRSQNKTGDTHVALHAGAWIETYKNISPPGGEYLSPSMRGRGLKPLLSAKLIHDSSRPPCGGVD